MPRNHLASRRCHQILWESILRGKTNSITNTRSVHIYEKFQSTTEKSGYFLKILLFCSTSHALIYMEHKMTFSIMFALSPGPRHVSPLLFKCLLFHSPMVGAGKELLVGFLVILLSCAMCSWQPSVFALRGYGLNLWCSTHFGIVKETMGEWLLLPSLVIFIDEDSDLYCGFK